MTQSRSSKDSSETTKPSEIHVEIEYSVLPQADALKIPSAITETVLWALYPLPENWRVH